MQPENKETWMNQWMIELSKLVENSHSAYINSVKDSGKAGSLC